MYDDLYDEFDWDMAEVYDEAMCTMADYAHEDAMLERCYDKE